MADIYWRDSQRPPRFFMFDARAVFPVVIFLFHARLWTFSLAIIIMILFWILERKGLNFTTALRSFRSFLVGSNRPRRSKLEKVEFRDFG